MRGTDKTTDMGVQARLIEVMVCPSCKGPVRDVRWRESSTSPPAPDAPVLALECPQCRLRFPIVDDIPVMLLDQAQRL